MSKLIVENPEDQTQTPFLRGILTRSLQKSGLNFKDAHTIANKIRDELDDETLVTSVDIEKLVIQYLERNDAANVIEQYENRHMPYILQVETDNGQFAAFSPSRYRTDLEAIGLTSEEALSIVDELSAHLLRRNKPDVTTKYIAKITYRILRKSKQLGARVAFRWLVWRDFVYSGRPIVFLIGGTSGSGKSTIATNLASRLEIARMQSTDMLREVMRTMIPSNVEPILHRSSYTAWQELPDELLETEGRNNRIYLGYTRQTEIIAAAIKAILQRTVHERVSVIIEGVHFHPTIIKNIVEPGDALVVPVMLAVLKRKQLQNRIKGRSSKVPTRHSKLYLEHFDEIWKLQSYLLSESDQAGVPIISNTDRDDVFREIMLYTIDKLAEDFDKTPDQVFD